MFDAQDAYFSSISGSDITGILIYRDCKDHHLIAFIDKAYSLPAIPNGGDIIVTWDNGTNKIFDMKEDFIDLKSILPSTREHLSGE